MKGIKHTQKFIENKAKELFGDDVSVLGNYTNMHTKLLIRCNKHNLEINQDPLSFIRGSYGCPYCKNDKIKEKVKKSITKPRGIRYSKDEFIFRAREIHGDKYDYSKVNYINSTTKVEIICPNHGSFWQTPGNHIGIANKNGCPICAKEKFKNYQRKTLEEFIQQAQSIHGDKYDYSKVNYVNDSTKAEIVCPTHGSFWQTPGKHLIGHGCSFCNNSKGNAYIKEILEEHNISFITEKTFTELRGSRGGLLKFDFYLPEQNTCIEFDGYQHFFDVEAFDGEIGLKERQYNDNQKDIWCEKNGINLIRIKSEERRFCNSDKENIEKTLLPLFKSKQAEA